MPAPPPVVFCFVMLGFAQTLLVRISTDGSDLRSAIRDLVWPTRSGFVEDTTMNKATATKNNDTKAALMVRIKKMNKQQLAAALIATLETLQRVPRQYRHAAVRLQKETDTKQQLLTKADAQRTIDEMHQSKFEFQLDTRELAREPYAGLEA